MVLSGLALAFSRLIDNSVVVLENIFRHLELGEAPVVAAEQGANEVSLAVLAITIVTVVVFFPVTLLFGVSKYLFTALALAVVISLFASYFVAFRLFRSFARRLCSAVVHGGHERGRMRADPGVPGFTRRSTFASSACWMPMIAGYRRFSTVPRK